MRSRYRRRTVLAALATMPALSGCTSVLEGDDEEPAGNRTTEEPPEPTETESETETETDTETETEPDDPETVAADFVGDLSEGAFERATERVDPQFARQLGPGTLESVWLGLSAVGGEYQELTGTDERTQRGMDVVSCSLAFEDGEHTLKIWVDGGAITGLQLADEYEQPDYVDPDTYTEESLTLEAEDCPLPGTVTVPDGDDAVPGVVFVHGTGGPDQDQTTGGAKPFADLAHGLATRGIASLRYDDRLAHCQPDPAEHTLDRVTVDDALVALDVLREADGVDANAVGVVGLSQGGMAVPRIAERDGDLVGGVAMAPPARPFEDLVIDQNEHRATVGEYERADLIAELDWLREDAERVRAGEYDAGESVLTFPGAFWESLAAYDQLETAQAVDFPLYVLQGERDYQVSVEEDFDVWREELADRPDTEFELYDGLNHLFLPGEGPSTEFEYFVRNNVDERVLEDVAAWIDGL